MGLHKFKKAFTEINPDGNPRFLILCDHASNAIPPEYDQLGLSDEALASHRGWDIGAANIAKLIANRLGCPAVLAGFSRLLIDTNRGLDDPTLIMQLSDGEIISGNAKLTPAPPCPQWQKRVKLFYKPYHDQIRHRLAYAQAANIVPIILSVHSFTPVWNQKKRTMPAAVLWDKDDRLLQHIHRNMKVLQASKNTKFQGTLGDNQPYSGRLKNDTLYTHATSQGVPHALIELRQDLVMKVTEQKFWADLLVKVLENADTDIECQKKQYFGSYCDD